MEIPSPLKQGMSPEEYKELFISEYCRSRTIFLVSPDTSIRVEFRPSMFEHAFFESSDRAGAKDIFSAKRAERMMLISSLLDDVTGERYFGWDKEAKKDNIKRCVMVHNSFDFVVVIEFFLSKSDEIRGRFITCYVADSWDTLPKIKRHAKWDFTFLRERLAVEKK